MLEDVRKGQPPWDPTPAEIAEHCARIRATWSAAETRRRSAWAQPGKVETEFVGADSIGLDPGYRD